MMRGGAGEGTDAKGTAPLERQPMLMADRLLLLPQVRLISAS